MGEVPSIEILQKPEFWRWYICPEGDAVDSPWPDKHENQKLVLHFRCGPLHSLILTIAFDVWDVTLELQVQGKQPTQLGWWDDSRASPFALRWEELQLLAAAWTRDPAASSCSADMARLLLARFVGSEMNDIALYRDRLKSIRTTYVKLGLFDEEEAIDVAEATLCRPFEADSRWQWQPPLGWVFTAEYEGYSLRNAAHQAEESFPFDDWSGALAAAEKA